MKYRIKKTIYPAPETSEDVYWRDEYLNNLEEYGITEEDAKKPPDNIAFVVDFGEFSLTATFSLFRNAEHTSIYWNTPSFGVYKSWLPDADFVFKDIDEYEKFALMIRKKAEKVTGLVFFEEQSF